MSAAVSATARPGSRHWLRLPVSAESTSLPRSSPSAARDGLRRSFPGWSSSRAADAARLHTGPVDHILSIEAAFHFDTRRAFLERAAAALRPGGTIRLADALFPPDWAGAWTVPAGNRIERPEDYAAMLTGLGFRHIRIEDITDRSWRPWARALARAVRPDRNAGPRAVDQDPS